MAEPAMRELLLLRAEDGPDLQILSACVQDMAVKPVDVRWLARSRRLVLVGNRYRWEAKEPTRIRSALRFEGVQKVLRREWPVEGHAVLPLLAVTWEPDDAMAGQGSGGTVLLAFGGGTMLRLEVEAVDATLEDLSDAWGAMAVPQHGDA
jgi:hypothetical protein